MTSTAKLSTLHANPHNAKTRGRLRVRTAARGSPSRNFARTPRHVNAGAHTYRALPSEQGPPERRPCEPACARRIRSSTYAGRCAVASAWRRPANLTCHREVYGEGTSTGPLDNAGEACSGGFAGRGVVRGRVPGRGRRARVLARPTGCRLESSFRN